MVRARWLVLTIVISLGIVSCNTVKKDFSCALSSQEGSATPSAKPSTAPSNSLAVSIQVDGSSSMLGYVSDPNSRYVQTLKLLDETLSLAGKTPVQYYRSGNPIARGDFRKAQLPAFYNGTQFPDVSVPIQDLVSAPIERDSLLVIVTDLDQASGDVTLLTRKIQETYLNSQNPEAAIGIWAIKSEFAGTVYVQGQQTLKKFPFPNEKSSEEFRPFYVIFLGHHDEIIKIIKDLKKREKDLFENSEIAIFSRNNFVQNTATLDRSVKEQPSEEKALLGKWNLSSNGAEVQAKDEKSQLWKIPGTSTEKITISDSVPVEMLENTVPIDVNSIDLVKTIEAPNKFTKAFEDSTKVYKDDSDLREAIEIAGWNLDTENQNNPRELTFETTIQPDKFPEPGIYLFSIDIVARDLQEQPWWEEWNWKVGRDQENDGSKTNNLLPFLRGLKKITTDLMAENPPKIGRFCYAIEKN